MLIDNFVMQRYRENTLPWSLGVLGVVAVSTAVKFWPLLVGAVPFNSDEAIVALMARHILQGERPVFFYGQAYMGSLDAFIVAAGFYLFGESVWVVRLVQIVLYTLTILTTAFITWRLTRAWVAGVAVALILAVPTSNLALYSTVSLGGYGEMLLIGNLILMLTIKLADDIPSRAKSSQLLAWFGLGFLCGFGLWVFGLTLVYSIAAVLYLTWYWYRTRGDQSVLDAVKSMRSNKRSLVQALAMKGVQLPTRQLLVAAMGALCGSFPWWAFVREYGFSKLFTELGGGAIAGVESLGYLGQIAQHLLNFSLFGSTAILGLRPPWEIRWLALPLAPIVILIWAAVGVFALRKITREVRAPSGSNYSHSLLLGLIVLLVVIGFVLSPFGADPSGRYFLPINIVMAIFAGQALWDWRSRLGKIVWVGFSLIIAFNFWGIYQVATKNPPGLTTQIDSVAQIDHGYDDELIEFLTEQEEDRGFTNYWVAYPLAYKSNETLVFVPRLPYHQDFRYTDRDDRYSPYWQLVDQADRTAYITTNNPSLDQHIRAGLTHLEVTWQEAKIGDYQVYYRLSRAVVPEELGLGENY